MTNNVDIKNKVTEQFHEHTLKTDRTKNSRTSTRPLNRNHGVTRNTEDEELIEHRSGEIGEAF